MGSPSKKARRLILAGFVMLIGGLVYVFPLFRIVSLDTATKNTKEARFSPGEFVERFWNDRLLTSLDRAVDAGALLSAIARDPHAARQQYGRQLGLGGTYFYFVKGRARVVDSKAGTIALALPDTGAKPDVVLVTGSIFGNALRDGTGLLDVNDFPNSQDFNQISAELNRRVETDVLLALRERVSVGAIVTFAGCAEIQDERSDLHPMRVIPIQAQVQ